MSNYDSQIGIPADDRTAFPASLARRKGLTIKLSRRMKHVYPRAIRLVESGMVDMRSLVSHRFPLAEFDKAFSVAQARGAQSCHRTMKAQFTNLGG